MMLVQYYLSIQFPPVGEARSITWVLAAQPLAQSKAKAPEGERIVFSRRGIVYLRQARLTSLTGISNSVNLLLVGVCGSLAIFFTQ